jgi:chromate reductase
MPRDIVVIVGSIRKESLNRKLAHAMIGLAPDGLKLEIVPIAQLQMFNQDLEATPTPEWTSFKDRVKRADAVLFVTPEYNRSVPGVLKNAIDVASRPYGHSAWYGKPAGVVTVSGGAIGGFGANHHLRQSLVFLNMPCMAQPEAYIGGGNSLFDNGGNLINAETEKFLKNFLAAFEKWVTANAA